MQAIAEQIYSIFDQLGYFAIFFGVMLDNAGFPVRGELVLPDNRQSGCEAGVSDDTRAL